MEKEEQQPIWLTEDRLAVYLQENTIDCVIFGYHSAQLKVLLLKWKGADIWSLPGGYILRSEDFDQAAGRILADRTGLTSIFLQQFHTFSGVDRNAVRAEERQILQDILQQAGLQFGEKDLSWFTRRFITTGYFALVKLNQTSPQPDFLSERCEWIPLKAVPALLADHNSILNKALEYLRLQLNYIPVGLSLLPEKFTMKDLRQLYESILGISLQRSNFQRSMLKMEILIRHEKQRTGAANKAPYLYSFNVERYSALVREGAGFYFLPAGRSL